jgi:hypothetical protein
MAEDIIRDIQHIVENDMLVLSFETPHLHYMSIGALLTRYDDSMWDTANNTVVVRLKEKKPIQRLVEIEEILDLFRDDVRYQSQITGEPHDI